MVNRQEAPLAVRANPEAPQSSFAEVTAQRIFNANHGSTAMLRRELFHQSHVRIHHCSDSRRYLPWGTPADASISAAGSRIFAEEIQNDPYIQGIIVMTHFQAGKFDPHTGQPLGCGGAEAKLAQRIQKEEDASDAHATYEGRHTGHYVTEHIIESDPVLQAYHSAKEFAITSNKATLFGCVDNLTGQFVILGWIIPENSLNIANSPIQYIYKEPGLIAVLDPLLQAYVRGKITAQEVYRIGAQEKAKRISITDNLPALSYLISDNQGRRSATVPTLPGVFERPLRDQRLRASDEQRHHPYLREKNTRQNPQTVWISTLPITAADTAPELFSNTGEVFEVTVAQTAIIRALTHHDTATLDPFVQQASYPFLHHGQPGESFSKDIHSLVINGRTPEETEVLLAEFLKEPWMKAWLEDTQDGERKHKVILMHSDITGQLCQLPVTRTADDLLGQIRAS